jgi:7-cyano-7-deazaguanine reductase
MEKVMRRESKSSYEALQEHVRFLKTPAIEVWENKYPDREYSVHLDIPECTCICPKTGLPDFVAIHVTYSPDKTCVELKSLKMYIVAFRDVGIFHEHLVNKILDDFVKACKPRWARVEGAVNPRGGITATVTAEYRRRKK